MWVELYPGLLVTLTCLFLFAGIFAFLRFKIYSKTPIYYFNPSDYALYTTPNNVPESSKTATFELVMKQYFDLSKVLVTLGAASIAFGGLDSLNVGVYEAKMFLAYSIGFNLAFCFYCLYSYETYTQNRAFYVRWRYLLWKL